MAVHVAVEVVRRSGALCRLRFSCGVWFAVRRMVGEPLQRVAAGTWRRCSSRLNVVVPSTMTSS
jgi:hypothetical protein